MGKEALVNKPRILLSALWDNKLKSYWMLPAYCNLLQKLGAIPFILPLGCSEEEINLLLQDFDGLVLCGGDDIDPALYNESPHPETGEAYEPRDSQEILLAKRALALGLPIFGVCRGLQIINTVFGGSLYQDLPSQFNSEINHHMDKPYDREAHRVSLSEGGLMQELLGQDEIGVNSCHHQGIKVLAAGLKCEAAAPDGLCEAVSAPDHPYLLAVQWHPEFSYLKDQVSEILLQSFVEAASEFRCSR